MIEKMQELYKELGEITILFMVFQRRDNIVRTKKVIPQIQEFVLWFLEENRFGIEEELYQGMSQNLINILEDILVALEQGDTVLLHDAIAHGLIEYLQLFVVEDQEEEEANEYV